MQRRILMKVTCKKQKLGTGVEISVYDAPSEYRNVLSDNSENNNKPIRIKRKFPKDLSVKQCEAVCITLTELFNNYNFYYSVLQSMGEKALLEAVEKNLTEKFNPYQLGSLNMILSELCIPVAFEKATDTNATDISYLDYEHSLSVALVGCFGYGKTTLIKELLNFDSSYDFLFVDGGRTTLCQTYVRAFIINENKMIYVPLNESENDEETEVHCDKYLYQNHIKLHTAKQAYDTIIVPALMKAFESYRKKLEKNIKINPSEKIEILRTFCTDEQYMLDSIFGSIPEDPQDIAEFYNVIIEEFEKITEPDMDTPDFTTNHKLRESFYSTYKNILQNLPHETFIIHETENEIDISFSVDSSAFSGDIDEYYKLFTNNKIKKGSLRVFVKQIYMETYIDGNNYDEYEGGLISLPALKDGNNLKFHSILFVDTVGVGHVKKSNTSQYKTSEKMSRDILANQDLLSAVDVIILIDKANSSMNEDVLSQIYSLESLGLIDKVILAYSYYNQFVKQDIDSDQHREKILLNLLENSLKSLYPDVSLKQTSSKAQRIFNSFANNGQAIVFLKGLVERVKKVQESSSENTSKNIKRASRRKDPITFVNADDKKADELNKGIENSTKCLGEIIEKIIARQESFQKLCEERASIVSHYSEPSFQQAYTNQVYNHLSLEYKQYEFDIYKLNTPHYNTTGALCRNATYGTPVHQGTSYRLAPVEDYIVMAQELISKYLDSTVEQALEILHDDDGFAYDKALDITQNQKHNLNNFPIFLGNEIKTRVAQKVKKLLMSLMVSGCQQEWIRMANDCGTGVKDRRANNIYQLITGITLMDTFQSKIRELTMNTIQEVVNEYSI